MSWRPTMKPLIMSIDFSVMGMRCSCLRMTREAVVSEALLNSFNLDARLQKDTVWMGDFPLSRVLLMNEARYPWFILVPRVDSVSEIYQLSSSDQIQLLGESVSLLKWMSEAFIPDKMNVAAIGRSPSNSRAARRIVSARLPMNSAPMPA